jgi:hypothetical protein
MEEVKSVSVVSEVITPTLTLAPVTVPTGDNKRAATDAPFHE